MKRLEIEIEDYVYEFYQKVAESTGNKTEQVLSDVLLKFAGDLSETMVKNKKPPLQN